MSDQAETLRKLMRQRPSRANATSDADHDIVDFTVSSAARCAPVITVSSGKGGVGKSCLAAHLGTYLARSGKRVMLVDGDFGLANLDILLGVQPATTLEQVLAGEARLQDAIVGVEPNLWLVPAASGLMESRKAELSVRKQVARLFDDCPWEMDAIILDIGAGIQSNVLSLHSPAFKSVIVLTPEPTSLTDAYGLIKTLSRSSSVAEFHVLVNQVTDAREARAVFQRLKDVADRFIDVRIEYLGHCEKDEKISQAVMKRKILLDWNGGERSSEKSLRFVADQICEKFLASVAEPKMQIAYAKAASVENVGAGNTSRFWQSLLLPGTLGNSTRFGATRA